MYTDWMSEYVWTDWRLEDVLWWKAISDKNMYTDKKLEYVLS